MRTIIAILAVLLVALCLAPSVLSLEMTPPTPPAPPQAAKSAVPADLPEDYGVYLQTTQGWQRLRATQAAKHEQKQSGFTQWTGMTVSGASFHIKVFYAGPEAYLRVQTTRPAFYVRMADATKVENLVIYRFKEHKDKRELETVQTSAERTGGGEQRAKAYGIPMVMRRLGQDVFVLTPENDLSSGEYILTGDSGTTGYDFAVAQ